MSRLKGTPQLGNGNMGSYNLHGTAVGESAALCQQVARMQHRMDAMGQRLDESLDVMQEVLRSLQEQRADNARLMTRVDRSSASAEKAAQLTQQAMEMTTQNAEMVVQSTLTLMYALASDAQIQRAMPQARQALQRLKTA